MNPSALAASLPLWLAYHGHLITHPGVAIALPLPIHQGERWTVSADTELRAWWHPRNQLAAGAQAGLGVMRQGSRGGLQGLSIRPGVQRSTWAVPTYVVTPEVTRHRLAGQGAGTLSATLSLGREVSRPRLDAWMVRPDLTLRWPDAQGFGVDVALQLAVRLGGGR